MPRHAGNFQVGRFLSTDPSSPWGGTMHRPGFQPLNDNLRVDVAVVGAGMTGACLAEHLTAQGRSVCVIDTPPSGLSGTAANPALLRWEHDLPFSELEAILGFDKAAALCRRSISALTGLTELIAGHNIACAFQPRRSLYLADGRDDAGEMLVEYDLRQRAGLPSIYVSRPDLREQFALDRPAAIVSPGAAEVDPLILERALLALAQIGGARLVEATMTGFQSGASHVDIATSSGYTVEANQLVLATGHRVPGLALPPVHQVRSSWGFATTPMPSNSLWPERALLWEASDFDPYLYARTSADNRIIVGGDDDETDDESMRQMMMPQKIATLQERLAVLWPAADLEIAHVWSGAYGSTADGLPLIGPVPGHPGVFGAFGFGGNGMTFAFMASRVINAQLAGEHRDWFCDFALDREVPRGL